MAANGIDKKQWGDVFASFSTATKATKAMATWKAYKIDGTPAMAIDGRFVTSPSMVNGRERCIAVMDTLIQRVRAEKGAGASAKK